MPDTFQALAVTVLALLPGALYFWAFERMVGRWGVGLADRALRFVGASALFHAATAPFGYWFWTTQWPRLRHGDEVSLWLWGLAVLYVGVPLGLGSFVGRGARLRRRWSVWLTGPDPAPRAWDYLFQGERDGWVRVRLKSGSWIAGAYATSTDGLRSSASGYPEPPDLFLSRAIAVDPATGSLDLDPAGQVVMGAGGLLLSWEEASTLSSSTREKTGDHV